jgi:serine/threonine-protein kinase
MNEPEERSDKRPSEEEPAPTASFSDLVLGPGSQIGPFRIERELGRGGMGSVYLAHDTKLDRSIAIKSLPDEVVQDTELLSRLKREAKILASLNHPGIATIYEELQQDERGYLVLEYIAGDTLADRIKRGELPPKEALSIALQIAEALSAAHNQAVIHRDLKPSNIKITPDGNVKVLDFGIAKTIGAKTSDDHSSLTKTGKIIGTPAYMSPEQVRGESVDNRSDTWSFGCVLYEMLTGRVPFKDKTSSDVVANILKDQPDWQALPAEIPANIRVMLRRCLEKDCQQRLQHISDAAIEISETLNPPMIEPPVSGRVEGYSRSILCWVAIAGLFVGLIVGVIAVAITLRDTTTRLRRGPGRTTRVVVQLPENQTVALASSMPLGIAQPAVSAAPDGSCFVYVADIGKTTQLFLRPMNELHAKPIAGTEGGFAPFFSPDSKSIGFFTRDKLKTLSLLGGGPVSICDATNPKGGAWASDDMIYFAEYEGAWLSRVSPTRGKAQRMVPKVEPIEQGVYVYGFDYGYPQLLPGGRELLLSSRTSTLIYSLEKREKSVIIDNGQHARYLPTGHIVYAQAGAIHAAPFSLTQMQVSGPSIPVVDDVMLESNHGTAQLAVSSTGLLVYVPGADTARSVPAWIDRDGKTEMLPLRPQVYGTFHISPNGRQLAMQVVEANSTIYVYDITRGTQTKLTLQGNNYRPIWAHDGKWIVFSSDRQSQGHTKLYRQLADGSGQPELLYVGKYRLLPSCYSRDSKLLVFTEIDPKTRSDIWVLPVDDPGSAEPVIATEASEWAPALSPDVRWLAYTSDRDGKFQVYVQPYPAGDKVFQISTDFGEEPIWSPNGDELFYRNGDKWMVVSISTELEFSAGTPQLLFEGPYNNVPGLSYDVAPDGQRFLVLQPQYDDSNVRELHVVTNWFEELKQLAPPDKSARR